MAPSAQAHKRAHSLLLFEKLLNLRDSASPLTLILDSLEQSAVPLTNEFMRRAKVSFELASSPSFSETRAEADTVASLNVPKLSSSPLPQ